LLEITDDIIKKAQEHYATSHPKQKRYCKKFSKWTGHMTAAYNWQYGYWQCDCGLRVKGLKKPII